jgi:hypothetical protein
MLPAEARCYKFYAGPRCHESESLAVIQTLQAPVGEMIFDSHHRCILMNYNLTRGLTILAVRLVLGP